MRASWTADPDEGVMRYEVEFADAFTLPAGQPGPCMEPALAGSLALGPQQADGLPEMIGMFLFVTGVDLDDPAAIGSPRTLMMYAVPDASGSYLVFDPEASDPCDPASALAAVRPTVEGNVLRFAVPSAVVGVDSVMMGVVGSTSDGLMDIVPEIPFLPIID